VAKITDVLCRVPAKFQVVAGSAGFLYPFLAVGAVGGVVALGNIAPTLCRDIFQAVQAGQHDLAQALQKKAIPLNQAVTARFGVPGLKQALDWLGYYGGPPRLPLVPLDETQQVALRKIMREGELLE
jgi:4-hydroxy-2-oxoglutarate aldolase